MFGQFDALAIIELEDESSAKHVLFEFNQKLVNICRDPTTSVRIADSTTMLAVNPDEIRAPTESYAVLAVDTLAGYEQLVCTAFRNHRKTFGPKSPVASADVVLGSHDVIVLIKIGTSVTDYLLFLRGAVENDDASAGITKTRTMLVIQENKLK